MKTSVTDKPFALFYAAYTEKTEVKFGEPADIHYKLAELAAKTAALDIRLAEINGIIHTLESQLAKADQTNRSITVGRDEKLNYFLQMVSALYKKIAESSESTAAFFNQKLTEVSARNPELYLKLDSISSKLAEAEVTARLNASKVSSEFDGISEKLFESFTAYQNIVAKLVGDSSATHSHLDKNAAKLDRIIGRLTETSNTTHVHLNEASAKIAVTLTEASESSRKHAENISAQIQAEVSAKIDAVSEKLMADVTKTNVVLNARLDSAARRSSLLLGGILFAPLLTIAFQLYYREPADIGALISKIDKIDSQADTLTTDVNKVIAGQQPLPAVARQVALLAEVPTKIDNLNTNIDYVKTKQIDFDKTVVDFVKQHQILTNVAAQQPSLSSLSSQVNRVSNDLIDVDRNVKESKAMLLSISANTKPKRN